MKTCSRCKEDLPFSEFHERGTYLSGEIQYQSMCKECMREASREGYHAKGSRHRELKHDRFILAGIRCY